MERHPKVKQELIFQASQCSRKPWWKVWVLGPVLPARSWWVFLTHPEPSATKQRNSPGGCWRMPAPEYIGQPRELHDSETLRDRVPKTPRQLSRGHYAVFYCIHNPRTWQRPALLECDACYRQAGCWAQHRYEFVGCDSPFQQKTSVLLLWHSTDHCRDQWEITLKCHPEATAATKLTSGFTKRATLMQTSPFGGLTPIASCLVSGLQRCFWL